MQKDFRDESIAYALAVGLMPTMSRDIDSDIDREARRARWARRKAKRA